MLSYFPFFNKYKGKFLFHLIFKKISVSVVILVFLLYNLPKLISLYINYFIDNSIIQRREKYMSQYGTNLFDILPSGFFNCLAGSSNNRIYSDCLMIIYHEYDREITYRIPRERIRDSLTVYLLENHINYIEDNLEDNKNYNSIANAIIRKFCSKDIGWLEEDTDDNTYEKHIIMTEQGVLLAEFLQQVKINEREEFSGYIINVYNILRNKEQWEQDPYVNAVRMVYRSAKQLSKALKRLSTYIRKIIERMVQEETLESLTENILEYCDGDFIREYARLNKQQNIHIYRTCILEKLSQMQSDPELLDLLVVGCCCEENLSESEGQERVLDMFNRIQQFFKEDYGKIMHDIKHKINIYLQIAVGRARFIRNRSDDIRGNVEQTIKILVEEMETLKFKDLLPDEMDGMFLLENNEFIDTNSVRYPKDIQAIRKATYTELEEMTQEDIEQAKKAHQREATNPYSKEKMKNYLLNIMGDRNTISAEEFPMGNKCDLLCTLSAVAYGKENGYDIEVEDGYLETQQMLLHRFTITKGGE